MANTYYKTYDNWMALIGEHQLKDSGETVKVNFLTVGILAKIADWEIKGKTCYMTNKQFADYFGVGERSITNSITVLRKLGLVQMKKDGDYIVTHKRKLVLTDYTRSISFGK